MLGICNGFQVLCEAGLLPGALVANRQLRFICRPVHVRVESTDSVLTRAARAGDVLRLPLNSYEGNYVAATETIAELIDGGRVVLRYCDRRDPPARRPTRTAPPTPSPGWPTTAGNVAGLMPHPERASEETLGSTDGVVLLESFILSLTVPVPAGAAAL